jgi:hypothetical protein
MVFQIESLTEPGMKLMPPDLTISMYFVSADDRVIRSSSAARLAYSVRQAILFGERRQH